MTTSLRYITTSCTHDPVRNFPERLPTAWAYSEKYYLVAGVCGLFVHRRWSTERHRKSIDSRHGRGYVGPYLAAHHTFAHVLNRVEFVQLARDMSSNGTGEDQARTGISRWYHSFQAVVPSRAKFTCSVNILTGVFD